MGLHELMHDLDIRIRRKKKAQCVCPKKSWNRHELDCKSFEDMDDSSGDRDL